LIHEAWEDRLHSFFAGVVRNKGSNLIIAGGMSDHVHLLISMNSTTSVASMAGVLKANSSRWIHEEIEGMKGFQWQAGYGAFSVSKSVESAVVKYIRNQKEHHRTVEYRDELLTLLNKHGVEYDTAYLWK